MHNRSAAPDLIALQRDAVESGRECVVGVVVFDEDGRVFVPRRSAEARDLPGIWDLVGGHVEPGESLEDAIAREVLEETGWVVAGPVRLVFVGEWDLPGDPPRRWREFDFVASVEGDLSNPRLAPGEHTSFRWVDGDEDAVLDENGRVDFGFLRRIVSAARATRQRAELTAPHATILLEPPIAALEALRRRWDPVMATQIGAHVTVAYPNEVADLDAMMHGVLGAARAAPPFDLTLGGLVHDGDPRNGVFVEAADSSGGWRNLRRAIAGSAMDRSIQPHVTLVHPRTSALGPSAWRELAARRVDSRIRVTAVAVTAFTGRRWITVAEHRLEGAR